MAKPASGLFSRLPLALILGLLASLSYLGYTAATRSISAFQESWNKTGEEALQDAAKQRSRGDYQSIPVRGQFAQAPAKS